MDFDSDDELLNLFSDDVVRFVCFCDGVLKPAVTVFTFLAVSLLKAVKLIPKTPKWGKTAVTTIA